MAKTNVIRILENSNIPYTCYEYDVSDGEVSGVSVAEKINQDADKVFKTLVTIGKSTGYNVFVIPCECDLDLKKAAVAAGDKNIEMIKMRELEPLTGYVHGGCSPIGMKKAFPIFIDEFASIADTILVNAGRLGLLVELPPDSLRELVDAKYCALV
jgi:Cys-tRNA(Pro)/Cys-tRNA(Cys) deacylase